MYIGSSIVIHQSPIIQKGLFFILSQLNIDVREVMTECPDCSKILDWKNFIVLIDTKHQDFIRKHYRFLQKNKNIIIGLDFSDIEPIMLTSFDEIVCKNDNQSSIINKISKFTSNIEAKNGSNQLSMREIEILKLVALGNSNKSIAEKLFISIHTVITHRKNITSKLGVKSIPGLTLYASINNLIDQV